MDPVYSTDVRSGKVCSLLYDTLVKFDNDINIIPSISHKWIIDDDDNTYTFFIKKNIKFHNGIILTSHHIKKTFERTANKETLSPRAWIFEKIEGYAEFRKGRINNISGIKAINDTTLQILLKDRFTPFLSLLATPSASITLTDSLGIYGTGPWKLSNRMIDGHLDFNRNEEYFNNAPIMEKLRIRILPEALPRIAEFVTGYLDIMEIPDSEYEDWHNDTTWNNNIVSQDELNTYYIGLNCQKPPFDNINVRRAVNYAIDIDNIIFHVLSNKATKSKGPIPPGLLSYKQKYPYNYNINKAKQLLNESGFSNGFNVTLWQSQSQQNSLITEVIQSELSKIGITIEIKKSDWNTFTQAIREGVPEMYYRSWYADYPDAENFLTPLFESTISKKRWNRYSNQTLDTLLIEIQAEPNKIIRNKMIYKANQIIIQDAPWIFLWHTKTAYITNNKIKNWTPSIMFNAENYTKVWKE